jgi:uncharacterized protein (DUF4415 family)
MSKQKEVKRAEKEIDEALNAPRKEQKIRVTTFIDADVIDELKLQAKDEGIPYQTLLNQYLRSAVMQEVPASLLKRVTSMIKNAG